ncbi:ATP-grasp fold amidoligase family protein [Ruminiclostridium cellobioparum]|uniref:ATP-grasp fold amidoligase family protein n=1 Tax=Ruminiclostridium cellobioparum TaxID=29355 RepID=UPI000485AE8F|nr:ATP-grasp fold amidoligase family protein [Ruminiclostridium cellobioparum]
MIKKLVKGIKNPKLIILFFLSFRFSRLIPDKLYLKIKYNLLVGKELNLDNPQTFNEKLQWLKLYDRKHEYTKMVDKFEVRKYITETVGEEYLIPLLGVYDNYDEIDFDALPNQFVLKPNHTSGNVYICKDKSKINFKELKKEVNMWLKREYYWFHREWPYKNIKPRIICEKYMVDESNIELKDYKIHCFGGMPKLIQVDFGRFTNHRRNLFDIKWNYIDASILYPNDPDTIIERPTNLDKVIEIASVLSKHFPYVRVDIYLVKAKIYFGELTFHHGAGYEQFKPSELELQMGRWLKLPDCY